MRHRFSEALQKPRGSRVVRCFHVIAFAFFFKSRKSMDFSFGLFHIKFARFVAFRFTNVNFHSQGITKKRVTNFHAEKGLKLKGFIFWAFSRIYATLHNMLLQVKIAR